MPSCNSVTSFPTMQGQLSLNEHVTHSNLRKKDLYSSYFITHGHVKNIEGLVLGWINVHSVISAENHLIKGLKIQLRVLSLHINSSGVQEQDKTGSPYLIRQKIIQHRI